MLRDFISTEERHYKVKFGKVVASSLSGFVAGAIFASIIWTLLIYFATIFGKFQ